MLLDRVVDVPPVVNWIAVTIEPGAPAGIDIYLLMRLPAHRGAAHHTVERVEHEQLIVIVQDVHRLRVVHKVRLGRGGEVGKPPDIDIFRLGGGKTKKTPHQHQAHPHQRKDKQKVNPSPGVYGNCTSANQISRWLPLEAIKRLSGDQRSQLCGWESSTVSCCRPCPSTPTT